ncbi:MAG TPA: phosphoadenylyl-sulfate reductase [Symbiobacteriaceae bacterium]|jgi:phosphoadenosine phosphosulfate reductase
MPAITAESIRAAALELAEASPEAIVRWAIERYAPRAALTCSFSGAGVVLAHMIARLAPETPVIFLDTGYHFPETLAFKDAFVKQYGLNLVEIHPLFVKPAEPTYQTDPDHCCHLRKVEPMIRAVADLDGWITALRRDQSDTRAEIDVVEYHETPGGRPLAKVLPLARWTRKEVWTYITEQAIPYHPMLDQGYKSIGCWPCTRPVGAGEAERAGRWAGTGKTECGLHTFTKRT